MQKPQSPPLSFSSRPWVNGPFTFWASLGGAPCVWRGVEGGGGKWYLTLSLTAASLPQTAPKLGMYPQSSPMCLELHREKSSWGGLIWNRHPRSKKGIRKDCCAPPPLCSRSPYLERFAPQSTLGKRLSVFHCSYRLKTGSSAINLSLSTLLLSCTYL